MVFALFCGYVILLKRRVLLTLFCVSVFHWKHEALRVGIDAILRFSNCIEKRPRGVLFALFCVFYS